MYFNISAVKLTTFSLWVLPWGYPLAVYNNHVWRHALMQFKQKRGAKQDYQCDALILMCMRCKYMDDSHKWKIYEQGGLLNLYCTAPHHPFKELYNLYKTSLFEGEINLKLYG